MSNEIECGSKCGFPWLRQLALGCISPENIAQAYCGLDIGHSGPHHDLESGATLSTDLCDLWCGELHPDLGQSSCFLPKGHADKEHMTIGGNRWPLEEQIMAQVDARDGQHTFTLSYEINDAGSKIFLEHPELGVFMRRAMATTPPADLKRLCEIEVQRVAELLRINYKLNVVVRRPAAAAAATTED